MNLDQAISLVQQQFVAEAQDQAPEGLREQYEAAAQKYPAMMQVAHHIWAQELIRQNLVRAAQQQQQQQQKQQAGQPNPAPAAPAQPGQPHLGPKTFPFQ